MGKIFRLSEKPSCFEATLKLIEESFHYQKPYSFEIDFAPLVDESNHHNCFILLDDSENVVAHIGVKDRFININNQNLPLTLIGGIAVNESRRGEGNFQALFQDVLAEKRSDTSLFLLWSDLEKLYNKFGFYLCGSQFEVSSPLIESPYIKTRYADLVPDEQKQIQGLYENSFSKTYLTLVRDEKEWELISKTTSADLYLQKHNGRIQSYYFQNKGQDLPGIIYEYGTKNDLTPFIKEISSYGKLWTGSDILPTDNTQFQFFMAPGDLKLFADLVYLYTNKEFAIRNINLMKQEVFFDFKEETLSLELSEFIRGVFGPGTFEELQVPAFFISGLDSI